MMYNLLLPITSPNRGIGRRERVVSRSGDITCDVYVGSESVETTRIHVGRRQSCNVVRGIGGCVRVGVVCGIVTWFPEMRDVV